jgi:hypothetical protein
LTNPMPKPMQVIDERDNDEKVVSTKGMDDGLS